MRKDFSLTKFSELVASINTLQDLRSILNSIIETTKQALDCEGCSLLLYNREEDCLEFYVSRGAKSEELQFLKVPKGKGIAGYIMENLETVLVNDAQADPRLYREIDQKVGFTTRNLIGVPMLAKGKLIGVLEAVNTNDKREFEQEDVNLLQKISEISAIAIHNHTLFNELNTRLHEINGLLQVSQKISQVKDIEEFLAASGEAISEFLGVSRISYVHKSKTTGKWKVIYSKGLPLDTKEIQIDETKGVIGYILLTREPLLVENINKTQDLEFPFSENYKTKSFISMPIKINEEIVGILNLTDKWNQKSFQKTDLKLLKFIINYMIESYLVLKTRLEREKYLQIQKELETARKFQIFSLPEIPSRLEDIELAVLYLPSKEIGGDFYDFIFHWEGLYSLVIGDVSGKGIPAALFMQLSKTVLNTQISKNIFPSKALLDTHKILQNNFESNMLVESMVIQIDTEEKVLKYASAGHNRQFYFNSKTHKLELLRAKGIPLGSRFNITDFTENQMNYNSGDILVLYTDGVTECRNRKGEMYTEERLADLIQTHSQLSASELISLIQDNTENFSQTEELEDDYTILIAKFL